MQNIDSSSIAKVYKKDAQSRHMIFPSAISPLWFKYTDSAFVLVAFLTTLFITLYSYRVYRLTEVRNAKYLALSFLIISLGLFFQSILDFSLWYDPAHMWIQEYSSYAPNIYATLFLLTMACTLFGYLTLTGLFLGSNLKSIILMGALFVVTLYSAFFVRYAVFHGVLTAVILVITLHYYEKYRKEGKSIAFAAFSCILAGHILFSLIQFHSFFYVVSHLARLAGFLLLAYNLYKVYRK